MEWSGGEVRKPRLGIGRMALALVVAAFLGGALGLLWHSADSAEGKSADSAQATEGD